MKLPFNIRSGLSKENEKNWQRQFLEPGRVEMEGLWRRTQEPVNAHLSGWRDSGDKRRRMIHFFDRYQVREGDSGEYIFELVAPYLWLSLALPKTEAEDYIDRFQRACRSNGWRIIDKKDGAEQYARGDIALSLRHVSFYPEDMEARRHFPSHYRFLDFSLSSTSAHIDKERTRQPWGVLDTGVREKDIRGNPEIMTDLKGLERFFPLQIELGCGPSAEAGIPPLHYLHDVYGVSDPHTGTFVLGAAKDDLLYDLVGDPEDFYRRSSLPYIKAITTKPTPFFRLVKLLCEKDIFIEPIITNNFDGLGLRLGLKELYVRRYDESHIIPDIHFNSAAKGLIVFGSHADRRKIQHAARRQGRKVIYVDPEGWSEDNGQFRSYPLESPQDDDILIRMTADEFARQWIKTFGY